MSVMPISLKGDLPAPDKSAPDQPDAGLEAARAAGASAEAALEAFIPYLMNSVIARYNREVEEVLRPAAISVLQMRTLAVLAVEGSRTINELSARCVTRQSTMSRTLDTMEAAGLLRRSAGTEDSRMRHVQLTPAGRRAYDRHWPDMEHVAGRAFAALSPDEQEGLAAMLSRVLHGLWRNDC